MRVAPCDAADTPIPFLPPQRGRFLLRGQEGTLVLTNLSHLSWVVPQECLIAHLRCVGVDGEQFSLPTPMHMGAGETFGCQPGGLSLTVEQRYDPKTISYRW